MPPRWRHGFTPDSVISGGPISLGQLVAAKLQPRLLWPRDADQALVKSINTVPVRLAKDHLGIKPIVELAHAMGVESPLEVFKTMVSARRA